MQIVHYEKSNLVRLEDEFSFQILPDISLNILCVYEISRVSAHSKAKKQTIIFLTLGLQLARNDSALVQQKVFHLDSGKIGLKCDPETAKTWSSQG